MLVPSGNVEVWIYLERVVELISAQPILPASVLLGMLVLYSVISVAGLIDLDFHGPALDMDLDFDGDFDLSSIGGMGMITVRWLNVTQVPIIVWVGCFTLLWWLVSAIFWVTFDAPGYESNWGTASLLSLRSAVIAVGFTKVVTEPMKKWFVTSRYHAENLIGKECEISTGEANADFGQARYKTDAAPLLLNIRTNGPTMSKGDRARIIDFDENKRIYTVADLEGDDE